MWVIRPARLTRIRAQLLGIYSSQNPDGAWPVVTSVALYEEKWGLPTSHTTPVYCLDYSMDVANMQVFALPGVRLYFGAL
jgi:hypothetical protein